MKFTVSKSDLASAIDAVRGAIAKKSTIPVLEGVLLSTEDGKVRINATDMDLEASVTVEANIESEGKAVAPGRKLLDIAKSVKDDIAIEADEAAVTVKSGRSRFKLASEPVDQFPVFMPIADGSELTLDATAFANMLRSVAPAAAEDHPANYAIQGIYLIGDGQFLKAVATDGYYLATSRIPCAEVFPGVILPSRAVNEMVALAKSHTGDVILRGTPAKVSLNVGDAVIMTKLLDAEYPEYERVIPDSHEGSARFEASDMKEAVNRALIVSDDKTRSVTLHFDGQGSASVTATGSYGQDAEDFIAAESTMEFTAKYNARYLLDACAFIDGVCELRFNDPLGPATVRPDGDEDSLAVLMPLRK